MTEAAKRKQRKQFEKWICKYMRVKAGRGPSAPLERNPRFPEHYFRYDVQMAWDSWQRGREDD